MEPISNIEKNSNLKLSFKSDPYKGSYNNLNTLELNASKCIEEIDSGLIEDASEYKNEEKELSLDKNISLFKEFNEAYESFIKSIKSIETANIRSKKELTSLDNPIEKNKVWKNRSIKALKEEHQLNIGTRDRLHEMLNTFQDTVILQPNKLMEELGLNLLKQKYQQAVEQIKEQHRTYEDDKVPFYKKMWNKMTEWASSNIACCGSEESEQRLQKHSQSIDQMEKMILPYQDDPHYVSNKLIKKKEKH